MSDKHSETSIDKYIIFVIKEKNPKTIEELVRLLQPKYPIPEQKILEHILRLQDQGKIVLEEHSASLPQQFKNYIFSTKAYWYWTVITAAIVTTTLVFTISENFYPIVYARYMLGAIFVLLLPGYSLIKALFPTKELDNIERIALSIGMSLALVSITGLLLNYTPWGIRPTPIVLSLLALTIIFATVAFMRVRIMQQHETQLNE